MTNEEAKQQAIKNAYGEYWDEVKSQVDENGFIEIFKLPPILFDTVINEGSSKWRPKSLQGIELIYSFKDIPNYEGYYQANLLGQIKGVERFVKHSSSSVMKIKENILTPTITKSGYLKVTMNYLGKQKTNLVHRLIAETFIPNHENKPQVNHKNGVKTDNRVENLEWATQSENIKHADLNGLRKMPKGEKHFSFNIHSDNHTRAKKVINVNTLEVFGSVKTLAESLKINAGTLRCKLNGHEKNNTEYMYLNDYNKIIPNPIY